MLSLTDIIITFLLNWELQIITLGTSLERQFEKLLKEIIFLLKTFEKKKNTMGTMCNLSEMKLDLIKLNNFMV